MLQKALQIFYSFSFLFFQISRKGIKIYSLTMVKASRGCKRSPWHVCERKQRRVTRLQYLTVSLTIHFPITFSLSLSFYFFLLSYLPLCLNACLDFHFFSINKILLFLHQTADFPMQIRTFENVVKKLQIRQKVVLRIKCHTKLQILPRIIYFIYSFASRAFCATLHFKIVLSI